MRRLERESSLERHELVCPECGWEIVVFGDVWLDLVTLDWISTQEPDEHSTFSPHPKVVELFNHEHHYADFVEKHRAQLR